MWRNRHDAYGWIAIGLHWLVALVVLGLFGLGLWMVELTYYDPWYNRAPDIHRSVGMLLLAVLALRLVWRWVDGQPEPVPGHRPWERRLAPWMHGALYALTVASVLAGYLISTADGRAVDVFGWFSVPATLHGFERQEDVAGEVHEYLAWALVVLTGLHALAALKHHVIDRDATLARMLRPSAASEPSESHRREETTAS